MNDIEWKEARNPRFKEIDASRDIFLHDSAAIKDGYVSTVQPCYTVAQPYVLLSQYHRKPLSEQYSSAASGSHTSESVGCWPRYLLTKDSAVNSLYASDVRHASERKNKCAKILYPSKSNTDTHESRPHSKRRLSSPKISSTASPDRVSAVKLSALSSINRAHLLESIKMEISLLQLALCARNGGKDL